MFKPCHILHNLKKLNDTQPDNQHDLVILQDTWSINYSCNL